MMSIIGRSLRAGAGWLLGDRKRPPGNPRHVLCVQAPVGCASVRRQGAEGRQGSRDGGHQAVQIALQFASWELNGDRAVVTEAFEQN
eukprot:6518658-Heterocapsa_arctica.AAC.1